MDTVNMEPGMDEGALCKSPSTEVVDLSQVNLEVLLEDMETICSSETNGASALGDNPKNYLWCSKSSSLKYNESTNTSSLNVNKSAKSSLKKSHQSNSDNDSTCGLVNIRNGGHFNMCENPSDLWFGLKMSDGTPVVINSRNRFRNNRNYKPKYKHIRKNHHKYSVNGIKDRKFSNKYYNGPIDYSGGFLSISKYIGSHRSEVYMPNSYSSIN
nr:hypothetical protein MACL_00001546 [Theileria orientalis]